MSQHLSEQEIIRREKLSKIITAAGIDAVSGSFIPCKLRILPI
jgi:hypothetical protein